MRLDVIGASFTRSSQGFRPFRPWETGQVQLLLLESIVRGALGRDLDAWWSIFCLVLLTEVRDFQLQFRQLY